jgi:hypothetical protein
MSVRSGAPTARSRSIIFSALVGSSGVCSRYTGSAAPAPAGSGTEIRCRQSGRASRASAGSRQEDGPPGMARSAPKKARKAFSKCVVRVFGFEQSLSASDDPATPGVTKS